MIHIKMIIGSKRLQINEFLKKLSILLYYEYYLLHIFKNFTFGQNQWKSYLSIVIFEASKTSHYEFLSICCTIKEYGC